MVAGDGGYKRRIGDALRGAGRDPDNTGDVRWLAERVGISYQAMKKIIDGATAMPAADNNARAARALKVSSEWLALGDVPMRGHSAEAAEISALYDSMPAQGRKVLLATAHALMVES